jgi:hypothetical protein
MRVPLQSTMMARISAGNAVASNMVAPTLVHRRLSPWLGEARSEEERVYSCSSSRLVDSQGSLDYLFRLYLKKISISSKSKVTA